MSLPSRLPFSLGIPADLPARRNPLCPSHRAACRPADSPLQSNPIAPRAYLFAVALLLAMQPPAMIAEDEPGSLAAAQGPYSAASQPTQNLKALSLEQLGNIEVTTQSKEPTEIWNTPAAIYVLTGDDIRRSGVTNVPDALRLVPGVNVERVNGSRNWVVAIRGLGDQYSKYVQVLIDGRSVYTPLFGGVYWMIDNVMIEDIDRIEVIRGPGGTIWGSDAVNGIINIITKPSSDTHGVLASAGGGSVDQDTESLRYGAQKHGVDFRLYGLGFKRSPEYHQDGQPRYDWSRLAQIGLHADWTRGKNEMTLQGDAYLGKFGDAQSLSSLVPPSAYISYGPTDTSGGNLLGRWRRNMADHGDIYLQAFWSHDRRIGSNFGEVRDTFDIDFLHRTALTAHQQFTYGAGLRRSPSTAWQVIPALGFSPPQKTDSIYSAFLQEEVRILPGKLSFTAGSKLEHNDYTGFEYQPNGRILWTPTPTTTLWASVSRAVRIPDRVDDELNDYGFYGFVGTTPVFAGIKGNTNLRAEWLVSSEEGVRTLLRRNFYLDFAGFHNQYHDLIAQGSATVVPAPVPPLPTGTYLVQFQYTNGIRGNTDGAEIAPEWTPAPWWRIKAAYSYLHVHVEDQPGFTDTVTLTTLHGSSPNSQVALRSQIDLPHSFDLDETIRYVGSLPAQQVKAYVTGDLRAGFQGIHSLDLSVTGQNLFQPHHAEFGISPGPNVLIERSIYAKITWTR